jgi:hypothetical protein
MGISFYDLFNADNYGDINVITKRLWVQIKVRQGSGATSSALHNPIKLFTALPGAAVIKE